MRLRFTIRDLLWLTLVVALAVGWWVNHNKWTALYHEAIDRSSRLAKERDDIKQESDRKLKAFRSQMQWDTQQILREAQKWKEAQQNAAN